MKLTDFEIMEKFGMLLSSIYLEGRITANEAERLAFYALYNNSCSTTNCYDRLYESIKLRCWNSFRNY